MTESQLTLEKMEGFLTVRWLRLPLTPLTIWLCLRKTQGALGSASYSLSLPWTLPLPAHLNCRDPGNLRTEQGRAVSEELGGGRHRAER